MEPTRDWRARVDVILIDEAGQFSLANAVAVSRAARSMVLLGDPQQLAQPTKALHPDGAGVSALGHLLDGHDTVPADRGVFLRLSYRMHPEITAFVSDLAYEGRLGAAPGPGAPAARRRAGWTGSGAARGRGRARRQRRRVRARRPPSWPRLWKRARRRRPSPTARGHSGP